MTTAQLIHLGFEPLIMRLCNRYLHLHALRVSEFLNLSLENRISIHWGHCLVHSQSSPSEIIWKLSRAGSTLDYISLANAAFDLAECEVDETTKHRRRSLALQLLNENKVKSGAVPVLIRREQWEEAIQTAAESNDASLLSYVLARAEEANRVDVIQSQIAVNPIALRCWSQLHEGGVEVGAAGSGDKWQKQAVRVEQSLRLMKGIDEGKGSKDPLLKEAREKRKAMKKACAMLGQDYVEGMTPCERVRAALKTGDPKMVEKVAKLVEVQGEMLLKCKLEHGFACGDAGYLNKVAMNAAGEYGMVVVGMGLEFIGRGKKELARALREGIGDRVSATELDAKLAKVE
jgi:hypothetical protein